MDAKQLRLKVLDLAIHGKLVPQVPSEEPASVLLAQIKKEKEALVKAGKLKKKDLETTPVASEDIPFEIPSSWEWCNIYSLSTMVSKGTTPRGGNVAYLSDGVGFLRAENIRGFGKLDLSSLKYIDEETHNDFLKRSILMPNDLLITIAGSLGRTAIVTEEALPLNTNQAVCFVRFVKGDIDMLKFISYALTASVIQNILLEKGKTTAIPNLTLEIIGNAAVPLPPLSEQKRIVAEIDKWMALIDRMEADMLTFETTAVQLRARLLSLAIQGKLGTQDPNDEPVDELLSRIEKNKGALSKNALLSEQEPFEIPSTWRWVALDSLNQRKGATLDPLKFQEEQFELYSVPIFETGMPEFVSGKEIGSSKQVVKKGDVLLCKINPHLNRVWEVTHHKPELKCLASSEWLIIESPEMDSDYLKYCLSSPYFLGKMLSNVSGVGGSLTRAQPNCVRSYLVPVPPIQEQKRIVQKIQQLLSKLDF